MHVEFGNDNRFKKRVTKQMKANFAEDQGFAPSLGSTAADSKSFDGLESACEDIETKAQLVANQLERDAVLRLQHATEFSPPAGVSGFYAAVKKGISALKKTNFKGLPRSDIASLESYLERLSGFKFADKFAELLAHFQADPLAADPAALAQAYDRSRDALAAKKVEIADLAAAFQQRINDLAQQMPALFVPLQETRAHNATMAIARDRERQLADEVRVTYREIEGARRITGRHGLVEKDSELVVPTFEVFLESLATGLQSYKSGVSGKNVIVGRGAYHVGMGGDDYLPRRYL